MSQQLLPIIKWSGSKRSQAKTITEFFPKYKRYFEPFLGGGSVLMKAEPKEAICGDVCKPLIYFWKLIRDNPQKLIKEYSKRWNRLQDEGYLIFYEIRDNFNNKPNPFDLLFLSRTCVNGLIRFNKQGYFNNSLHHTRKGINPNTLEKLILERSQMIQNYKFVYGDYSKTVKNATRDDFVYLDPPYFNTKGRYYGRIDHNKFLDFLEDLNSRKIRYILSFDGYRGSKDYTVKMPQKLFKRKFLLDSGNASFKKVMDKKSEMVRESIYLNF